MKMKKKLSEVKIVEDSDEESGLSREDVQYLATFTQGLYNAMVPIWNEADGRPDGVSVSHLATSVSLACWHMIREVAPSAIEAAESMTGVVIKAVSMDTVKEDVMKEIRKTVVATLGVDPEDVEVREIKVDDEDGETTWDMLDKVGITVKKPSLH